jgi:hypothetical protein
VLVETERRKYVVRVLDEMQKSNFVRKQTPVAGFPNDYRIRKLVFTVKPFAGAAKHKNIIFPSKSGISEFTVSLGVPWTNSSRTQIRVPSY